MAEKLDREYLSHRISETAKKNFNKLSNDLGSFAISNGFDEPNKGDLLSKLIDDGSLKYSKDPASYFKTK